MRYHVRVHMSFFHVSVPMRSDADVNCDFASSISALGVWNPFSHPPQNAHSSSSS